MGAFFPTLLDSGKSVFIENGDTDLMDQHGFIAHICPNP
jgi:hypothetical protein